MSSDATRTQSTTAKIAPWLSVADATRAVEYYKAAFGALELERLEDEAGSVVVAQLSIGGADFWVQQDPGRQIASPHDLNCRGPRFCVRTSRWCRSHGSRTAHRRSRLAKRTSRRPIGASLGGGQAAHAVGASPSCTTSRSRNFFTRHAALSSTAIRAMPLA